MLGILYGLMNGMARSLSFAVTTEMVRYLDPKCLLTAHVETTLLRSSSIDPHRPDNGFGTDG
jgi:hypothetical protein